MAEAVFLLVAAGVIGSTLGSSGHFDITSGLAQEAVCKNFMDADQTCRKKVAAMDAHKASAEGAATKMNADKFSQALQRCNKRKLTPDEMRHVCGSKKAVRKVFLCYGKVSWRATPKRFRKEIKALLREYRKCFLKTFVPEQKSSG
ncbi:uncharacterized protein LOC144100626 [Amblyomma americanum]